MEKLGLVTVRKETKRSKIVDDFMKKITAVTSKFSDVKNSSEIRIYKSKIEETKRFLTLNPRMLGLAIVFLIKSNRSLEPFKDLSENLIIEEYYQVKDMYKYKQDLLRYSAFLLGPPGRFKGIC